MVGSLQEVGEQLFTFYALPRAMCTTNSLKNLDRERRRRTNTQASFRSDEAAATLLYGLVAFGQIRLRKIDGHLYVTALYGQSPEVAA